MKRFAIAAVWSLAALSLVGAQGCNSFKTPIPVLHYGLDEVRYLRCRMRPSEEDVYSANYDPAGDYAGYRPGAEVVIQMFSAIRVDLTINGSPHKLWPIKADFPTSSIDAFLEKYFVKSPLELGLDEDGKKKKPKAKDDPPNPLADEGDEGDEEARILAEDPDPLADDGEQEEVDPLAPEGWRLDLMKRTIRSSVESGIAAVGMTKQQVYMALGPPAELDFGAAAVGVDMTTILSSNRWGYINNQYFPFFFKTVYLFQGGELTSVEQ